MSRYLVTGASGFVGGALSRRLLADGHQVVTVLRDGKAPPGVEFVRGPLEDDTVTCRALMKAKVDGVFHLAAHAKVEECENYPYGAWESNVRATYSLLETLRGLKIPTVVATSDHMYGDHRFGDPPSKEDDPVVPGANVYDVSKACADTITQYYARQGDVRIVRCGNIYGPGDRDLSRAIPSFINDALDLKPIRIRSDGSPRREYLYIDDAVDAYLAVMKKGGRYAYNFAGGENLSVKALADKVVELAQCFGIRAKSPVVEGTRKGDIRQIRLDTTRAKEELGWEPKTLLNDGLWKTIRWWKDERDD